MQLTLRAVMERRDDNREDNGIDSRGSCSISTIIVQKYIVQKSTMM